MPTTVAQAHLERRGALYYWRRRWPKAVLDRDPKFFFSRKRFCCSRFEPTSSATRRPSPGD
jgi:hypothetical protein